MNVKCPKCSINWAISVITCVVGIPGRSFIVFGIHPHFTGRRRVGHSTNGSHLEADTDVVLIYFTMPGSLRSKVWVCGHSLDGVVGSNPAGAWMPVSYECFYCQVEVPASGWSLVQNIPIECCASECDHKASIMSRPWAVAPWKIQIYSREYTIRKRLTLTEGEDAL